MVTPMKRLLPLLLILALALIAALFAWRALPRTEAAPSLIGLLASDDTDGYARATRPNAVQFPRDLGPHDDYQTEWWYYTGNLQTADGRPFGFQLTFFRSALTPPAAAPAADGSPWRTNQVYLAHFTISDIVNNAFYPAERFSRGAAGLAGAAAAPYHVWLQDWTAQEVAAGQVRLFARADAVALDLTLTQTLPPVLHGDGGLSQKGPQPGNASYYYSIVQQQVQGQVRIGEQAYAVTGLAWTDHEYSTSALNPGAVGWDWFSIQLDDGAALMFFQIRRQDGSLEPYSSGSFIAADGAVTPLRLGEWTLTTGRTWTSPTSGVTYPVSWQIAVPALDLRLAGAALMPNQELNVSTTYWEGAVSYTGTRADQPITAQGYVEMTGY